MAILFWKGSQWGTATSGKYLELVNFKDFATAHPVPVIEASRQLDAASR